MESAGRCAGDLPKLRNAIWLAEEQCCHMSRNQKRPPGRLVCVCADRSRLQRVGSSFVCTSEVCHHSTVDNSFPIVGGVPIVISEEVTNTVCSRENLFSYVKRTPQTVRNLAAVIADTSRTTRESCLRFVGEITSSNTDPIVLVIGSGEKGKGTESLWDNTNVRKVGIDIYISESVDVVCDAHYLPFEDKSFDRVWIQDVLEHVVEPHTVVSEIYRVLKSGGVIYSETPFLLAVHEGAYDFTRFTVLGHRYLFKRFKAIDFGGARGSDVALGWSMRYFLEALFRSKKVGQILGVLTILILRPIRSLLSKESLFDSPAQVYFLGTKNEGFEVSHRDLVALYAGNG
jgi:SAM-dependent methyltransferase